MKEAARAPRPRSRKPSAHEAFANAYNGNKGRERSLGGSSSGGFRFRKSSGGGDPDRTERLRRLRAERLGLDTDTFQPTGANPDGTDDSSKPLRGTDGMTLLEQHIEDGGEEMTEDAMLTMIETERMQEIEKSRALQSVAERATGEVYTKPMPSTWKAPSYLLDAGEAAADKVREEWMIDVTGERLPPPCTRFEDMKIPKVLVDYLATKGITRPSPIQCQGIPVALSGRDSICVAYTGSGKTLAFGVPAVLWGLVEELRMPLVNGEGPISLILCPSRELARQSYTIVKEYADVLSGGGFPEIRCAVLYGGVDMKEQGPVLNQGAHVIVCTPGRLLGMLKQGRLSFDLCRYFCMDEADRMIDTNFVDDVRKIIDYFKYQRQTALFSATMPQKLQSFAATALVDYCTVNVGRAGATSLDVQQDVEFVASDKRYLALKTAINKTPPPVLVFSGSLPEVDSIHQYLLTIGVGAVAIHGQKDQSERERSINLFRAGDKDVLVASDVASKGLDFKGVKHVINFDMPDLIENYVHRIGRTGRGGATGLATTFVNHSVTKSCLLDLKHLLSEGLQEVPPFLLAIPDTRTKLTGDAARKPCEYCQGLGHRLAHCEKYEQDRRNKESSSRQHAVPEGVADW